MLTMSVSAFFLNRFAGEVDQNGDKIQQLTVEKTRLETRVDSLQKQVVDLESKQEERDKQYAELDKKVAIIESKRAP